MAGDALQMATVKRALTGADVVIQSLGVEAGPAIIFKPTRLFSTATRVLVAAMEEAQVKRLICVTGFGAGDSRGRGGLLYSVAFHLLVGRIYDRGTGLYGTWLPLFRLSRSSSRLSCGGLVVRRRDSINGQFAARRTELLESPAYRTLSRSGHMVISQHRDRAFAPWWERQWTAPGHDWGFRPIRNAPSGNPR
jgi:NAD(P)H-binding